MLSIIIHPNEILKMRSREIDRVFLLSEDTQRLIKEMVPTMRAAEGVGLAAPQVGENVRVCIIAKEADPTLTGDLVLANPTWQKLSRKYKTDTEGCLSIPNTWGKVKRWLDIHVDALDENGNPLSFDAHNLFARVVQHEVDHLDGILFIDKAKDITVERP